MEITQASLLYRMRKGLAAAVQDYAQDWSRQNQIAAEVKIRSERRLELDIEQTAFRIMQEALANISRHSAADIVEILLDYRPQSLELRIADNGRGYDTEMTSPGIGLQSMRERAESLGGTLTISSSTGAGTAVSASLPLSAGTNLEDESHG